jgi:arylsulfatase A-like enzyme
MGDRQLADKWLMYDVSIRIPLIIYDPRINKPTVINEMVLNIDIPNTILSLAGVSAPEAYQGKSLTPFLTGKNVAWHRKSILVEHLWDFPSIPSSEGIRTDRWKYLRYRLINAPEELYDLNKDPLEQKNLAQDKKYSRVLAELRNQLEKKSNQLNNQKLCPDDPFISPQQRKSF